MGAEGDPTPPLVSVVMAVRNEGGRHVPAIQSVLAQDYPHDLLEVIVVVGRSEDDTLDLARELGDSDDRLVILENPDGTTPVSLNIGFRRAKGTIVGRVDGHAWVATDFVSRAVAALQRSGADGVGGIAEHVSQGTVGEAIALAMSSPLGSGNASFRVGGQEGPADTVVFGMYRREIFERVGLHDETLRRNQDDELNHRIRLNGGTLWFDPSIRSSYEVRGRLRDLWRQYLGYGEFRVHTLVKHRRPGALRQLAPPMLVGLLGAATIVDVLGISRLGRGVWLVYTGALVIGGVVFSRRAGRPLLAPLVATAAAVMHIAHGLGFWRELGRRLRAAGTSRRRAGT